MGWETRSGDGAGEPGISAADDPASAATTGADEARNGPGGLLPPGGAPFCHNGGGVASPFRDRPALKTVALALLVVTLAASGVAALAYSHAPVAGSTHLTTNAQPDLGSRATHAAIHLPVEAASPQGGAAGPPTSGLMHLRVESARGHPDVKGEVALTFDDGPSPISTPQVLAALQTAGAHATFFVVGRRAAQFPDLVRAEWLEAMPIAAGELAMSVACVERRLQRRSRLPRSVTASGLCGRRVRGLRTVRSGLVSARRV
jgi:Polysaccharide deacetylase